jgi:hypothetical protein
MSKISQFLTCALFCLFAVNVGLAQKVKGSGTPARIPKWIPENSSQVTSRVADSIISDVNGKVGIGDKFPGIEPGEKLTLLDGNFFMEGGGEVSIKIKRDIVITGPSGLSSFPVFQFGRIIQAGDGDPEFRFLYSDDMTPERSVFEFDRKGIVASVKPEVGSHFEGFVPGPTPGGPPVPVFRLNSFPKMRLEMGDGSTQPELDVAIQREAAQTLTLLTGNAERVRIDANGNVGIGTDIPAFRLDVAGVARATNFITPSDARFKTNVAQLTHVLDKLETVRGVSFDWRDARQSLDVSSRRKEIGVIAQELEAVFPELVTRWGEKAYRAVDYGRLAGVLVEAIKELRAERTNQVEEIEAKVGAQQREITALLEQNAVLALRLTTIERMLQRNTRRASRARH